MCAERALWEAEMFGVDYISFSYLIANVKLYFMFLPDVSSYMNWKVHFLLELSDSLLVSLQAELRNALILSCYSL